MFQPNIIDPAVQSSENIQHGNQKSIDTLKRLQKENGEDVGAREENDSNYFVAEEQIHNDHIPNEDQANDKLKKSKGNQLKTADVPNINDDDLQVIQQANDILEDNRNKLKNEVNEDQGLFQNVVINNYCQFLLFYSFFFCFVSRESLCR